MARSLKLYRKLPLAISLLSLLLFCSPSFVWAQSAGQADLDKATDLKIEADSIEKLVEVIDLCKKAIEKGLNDEEKALAQQLLSSAAFEQAEKMTQRMAQGRLTPRSLSRQRDEAIAALELALANNDKFPEAWILKAKLYTIPEANQEKAVEAIGKAIELLQDRPMELADAYLLRAQLVPDIEDKLADITKATEANPSNINAWQIRIALLDQLGKSEDAYKASLQLIEREPENLVALEVAVRSLLKMEKTDDAVEFLGKRIEQNSKNSAAYRMRAQLLRTQDKKDAALQDLNKAIEINKKDAISLLMRSEIYLEQEKLEQARADIDEALLVEPNLVQGILMRSLVAAQEKRYSDAIADMRKLVRAQPDNPAWMLQLASYYQLDNRPRMSIKVADEVIKKDEKNWRAHRLRGDALLSVGDHKLAVGDYEKAITLLDAFKSEQAAQKDENKPDAGKDETKTDEPKEGEKEEPAKEEGDEAAAAEDDNSDLAGILNNLAWVLATSPKDDIRNGKRSLELGLRACELTKYKEAHILSTLAAGYAESGDMTNAIKWSEKAVEAGKEEQAEQLEQLEKELESYKAGKPWREEQKQQENEVPVGSADRGIDS